MTFNNLISKLTKLEVGKSEIKVGDMREVLKRLKDLIKEDEESFEYLIKYLNIESKLKIK